MEKCKFCKMPLQNGGIVYVDRLKNNKQYIFCSEECSKLYQGSKGIYLDKSGGWFDKMMSAGNRINGELNKVNDGLKAFNTAKENAGCFITTATCKSRNLPDDCKELTTLRMFRDSYMRENCEREEEVREYYRIAPIICSNIEKKDENERIYNNIYENWIKPSVEAIDKGQYHEAYELYKKMVLILKEQYYQ